MKVDRDTIVTNTKAIQHFNASISDIVFFGLISLNSLSVTSTLRILMRPTLASVGGFLGSDFAFTLKISRKRRRHSN